MTQQRIFPDPLRRIELGETIGTARGKLNGNFAAIQTAVENIETNNSADARTANAVWDHTPPGKSVTISDVSPFGTEIYGLSLYGEGTQNGVPSPDAPVPISGASDPYVNIAAANGGVGGGNTRVSFPGAVLRGVGAARDAIDYVYGEADFALTRRAAEVTLNGSEPAWSVRNELSGAGFYTYQVIIPCAAGVPDTEILCSRFIPDNTTVAAFERVRVTYSAPNIAFQFTTRSASLGLFKSWLSLYNVVIWHKTAPQTAPFGSAAALRALKYGSVSVSADGNADFTLKYSRDLNSVIAGIRNAARAT